jgi:hypothetical protein
MNEEISKACEYYMILHGQAQKVGFQGKPDFYTLIRCVDFDYLPYIFGEIKALEKFLEKKGVNLSGCGKEKFTEAIDFAEIITAQQKEFWATM